MENKKSEPLFSICIPTFNRSAALDRLLHSIRAQSDGMEGKFEVCISDNCSPDRTAEVVRRWRKKLPIRYSRNLSNIGYDRNVLAALSMAHGKFVWFMGDDDLVCEGAFASVLTVFLSQDATGAGAVYLHGKPSIIKFDYGAHRVFLVGNKGYAPLNIGFIGSVCVNTDVAKKIVKNKILQSDSVILKVGKRPHLFDDFMHTYLFLECASLAGEFAIVPFPCVEFLGGFSSVSHEKKFYLDTILMTYALEIREVYPWFNSYSKMHTPKAFFSRAAIVTMRPGLEGQYSLCLALHRKLLSQDGDAFGLAFLSIIDCIRRVPIARELLPLSFRLFKKIRGIRIVDEADDSERMKERMAFASARARSLL